MSILKNKKFNEFSIGKFSIKLVEYKNKPWSKSTRYLIFETITAEEILMTKPINNYIENVFHSAKEIGEILGALRIHKKIKKEDEKVFKLLQELYY